MADSKKKVCEKKKVNSYSKSDCEKELARLQTIGSGNCVYADHIRVRLQEVS